MDRLVATGLKKRFGSKRVLRGVNLSVSPGEVVGLLGPNGAGKTTTFYILAGIERADEGVVLKGREDITDLPLYRRARMGIGYLSQQNSLFRGLTVWENIVAVLQVKGGGAGGYENKVKGLLEEFDLGALSNARASGLSGGEARRLEIARCLALEPEFVLMDEPFAGIDPITVKMVQEMIVRLKSKGLGVLISDHNVRETLRICDRAFILSQGEVIAQGSAKDLVANEMVKRTYLGSNFRL